jgi:hypothetical protein
MRWMRQSRPSWDAPGTGRCGFTSIDIFTRTIYLQRAETALGSSCAIEDARSAIDAGE